MGEENEEQEVVEKDISGKDVAAENKKNKRPRKAIGNLLDNIKGAFRGNAKDIFVLKAKLIIYGIIAVIVFFALIIEGIAEETSATARNEVNEYYSNSDSESAKLYNSTGSLSLSTNNELKDITNNYLSEIKKTNESYYDAFNTEYSGKQSNTVANKVSHVTTNFESKETATIDVITDRAPYISGAASPLDKRTIYEHILRTEKYNFNNIIWRSFVKSGSGLTKSSMSFRLDEESGLVYPASDPNASNNDDLDLNFFLTKVRPYLQSWYIPFNLIIGTQDAQNAANLNTDFAYEIITSAYHEIVLDRYKLENLTRETNYLIYDKTTITTTTTRKCDTYKITENVERKQGSACNKDDYDKGLCEDSVMNVTIPCTDADIDTGVCYIEDESGNYPTKTVSCNDEWYKGCSYGVLKQDVTETVTTDKKYCIDTVSTDSHEQKDVRESINTKTDTITYSWNYVISSAKMLDKVISYQYNFQPFYQYSLTNYNNFIAKKGEYSNMTVADFRELEQNKSKAIEFTVNEQEYNDAEVKEDVKNAGWNKSYVINKIPEGAVKVEGTTESKQVVKTVEIVKEGKKYTDTYNWSDTLNFAGTKSGIYNVDSVKDVTGDDLTSDDYSYYNSIYAYKELNLIDLMNSNNELYENYVEVEDRSSQTNNIGIRRDALDISYNVLENSLRTLAQTYPITGLMYGSSFNILEGLNLGAVVAAGTVNDAIVVTADAHLGYDLNQMLSLNTYGTFFRNHWCAMFVSYCMRTVEDKTGVTIPIPNYTGCSTFWRNNHTKPGFYDVQEWVEVNPNASLKNTDPANIAPMAAIQPGDIILYSWDSNGIRNHTAIVKSVEKDSNGNVISITTIDGNWEGNGDYNKSKVKYAKHTAGGGSSYTNLSSIASFVSVSTVLAEAEQGNIW